MVLSRNIFLFHGGMWLNFSRSKWKTWSVCLVPLCSFAAEGMKITPSLVVSGLRNPKASLCLWQKISWQVLYLVTKSSMILSSFVCYAYIISIVSILYIYKGFYPSPHFHLQVLLCHANYYSIFHFCDMSLGYLSLFELAVATHY